MLERAPVERYQRQDRERAADALHRELRPFRAGSGALWGLLAACSFALGAGGVGCDADGPDYIPEGPPPHVVRVDVTTGSKAGVLVREALNEAASVSPATTTSIGIVFDRYLDPRTALRQSYCLQSELAGAANNAEECLQALSTTPTYDPVSRTVKLFLDEPLAAATTYRLSIYAARDGTDFGFRAFDETPVEATVELIFTTLDQNPAGATELESPADLDAGLSCSAASDLFAACRTCHADRQVNPDTGEVLLEPPLDLSFQASGLQLAINRVAKQTALGNQGDQAATKPARFGAGMPVIQSKNPGNSYAIYKTLARARYFADTMAEGELERLQAWIVGSPMPAHETEFVGEGKDPESTVMPQGELVGISNWIAAGAACP